MLRSMLLSLVGGWRVARHSRRASQGRQAGHFGLKQCQDLGRAEGSIELKTMDGEMRMMGMGAQVDRLEVGMNRAAEQATSGAMAIFLSALKKMSFDDARRIPTAGDTAATEYSKRSSCEQTCQVK
jgi:Protein of unknown function (DUF4197)